MAFNDIDGEIITAGGDGTLLLWDLRTLENVPAVGVEVRQKQSITKISISKNNEYFAYAVSYDYANGIEGKPIDPINSVYVGAHPPT